VLRLIAPHIALCFLVAVSQAVSAQTVIWTTDPRAGAAAAVGSLADVLIQQWEHNRTTPMTHRKVGVRPGIGQELLVRPGEVIVARVPFEAAYLARARNDFVNSAGVPVTAESFRALRMLNNRWCIVGGSHCFEDKDGDKDWDGAGQAKGRWVDVPFEVFELRKELTGQDRRELQLVSADGLVVEYREYFAGALATREACTAVGDVFDCRGLTVRATGRKGDALRFQIVAAK
jgi:hypothetical protein